MRVIDGDEPALGLWGRYVGVDMTADVHADTDRTGVEEVTGDEVGGETVGECLGTEEPAGRQPDLAACRVDHEPEPGVRGGRVGLSRVCRCGSRVIQPRLSTPARIASLASSTVSAETAVTRPARASRRTRSLLVSVGLQACSSS